MNLYVTTVTTAWEGWEGMISSGGLKGAFSACAQIYVTFGIGKDDNNKRGIGMGLLRSVLSVR